ncbi:unnamed protein product [Arabidopsis thaliana]|uniref:Cystatin/monellin superfamily protein n=1 Tax=Arabidopsis thaliana TaxID=3702 RepID=Q9LTS8_ARATH|nr:Cystatin/monellin superfamily protein [Arabidopsis thaliana]AED96823.1 Cystatin/monellin superfamily protein [Arabidopsis thaliana]BAA97022.1 unnamed protein product [Arabidopsis thaliana]|eukprot:NP_200502.1 Cystatin/monellin superfamily protein [Arabidopsis thaliana]
MADSLLMEVNYRRPEKIPKLDEDCEGSESSSKQRVVKWGTAEDDEYLRQYLLFHYQFQKTQGFSIKWEQFDYNFRSRSMDKSPNEISERKSNAVLIREMTLTAIDKHNEAHGTKLVFVEHVEANYQLTRGLTCWLTFWATDMASSPPQSKIYQAHVWRRGQNFHTFIFRLKPTDEEIEAVEVQPPSPMLYELDKPPIVFSRPGPEDEALPGVPFVFNRTGAGLDPDW